MLLNIFNSCSYFTNKKFNTAFKLFEKDPDYYSYCCSYRSILRQRETLKDLKEEWAEQVEIYTQAREWIRQNNPVSDIDYKKSEDWDWVLPTTLYINEKQIWKPEKFQYFKIGRKPTNASRQFLRRYKDLKTAWNNMQDIALEASNCKNKIKMKVQHVAEGTRKFILIKTAGDVIGNYYLKAKYNPKTPMGFKFINSLYDENF